MIETEEKKIRLAQKIYQKIKNLQFWPNQADIKRQFYLLTSWLFWPFFVIIWKILDFSLLAYLWASIYHIICCYHNSTLRNFYKNKSYEWWYLSKFVILKINFLLSLKYKSWVVKIRFLILGAFLVLIT